jgi:hypothetical protein
MKTEIRWPTVALVAVVCAFLGGIFWLAPPKSQAVLVGILAMVGTTGAAVMRAAFGAEAPKPKRLRPDHCKECGVHLSLDHKPGCSRANDDPGEGGEVLADGPPTRPTRVSSRRNTLLAVPTGLALMLSACSPSALQTHATIALVASHTLEVTRASSLATCAALRDTCHADAVCIEHTRTDCLAVADAQDATVAAVAVYVDAVQLAALADEGRVMETLRFALEAASRAWVSLGERLAAVGIALPSLEGVQ